jgi:hypothetical protein
MHKIEQLTDELHAALKGKTDPDEIIGVLDAVRRRIRAIAAAAKRRQRDAQHAKHSPQQLDLFECLR